MDFFNFIKKESTAFESTMLLIFALAGLFNFLIIVVIIATMTQVPNTSVKDLLIFIVAVFAFVKAQKYSLDNSTLIVEAVVTRTRIRLADKIRQTDLASYEHIGEGRLVRLLTQETMNISEASKLISRLCSSATLLIVAFLYIAYQSLPAFFATIGLITLGVQIYRVRRGMIESELSAAADKETQFFSTFNHLLDGFKELKISESKSDDFFFNHLTSTANETERLKVSSSFKLNKMIIFAQIFCYNIMGIMIFIFPRLIEIAPFTLIQIVSIILFVTTGPLQEVVGSFPFMERANLAVRKIRDMETELEQAVAGETRLKRKPRQPKPFESLSCADLAFEYNHSQPESVFRIGPIDFELKRGEIVFFMGGNGAGKSTFLKVLTGLYMPTGGGIVCNGRKVTLQNISHYRSNFSIIFQDMHLFDRLYGVETIDPAAVDEMLERMQLEDKTSIFPDGRFENINLSAGQKKRLALIVAELDGRDIFVFDEWAADQDPNFRRYFYEVYLKDLKNRGKTVIAVTHDDKYYNAADRIFKMEYGKISELHPSTDAMRASASMPNRKD
ncbi:MAG: cyclic peptide export ABC transporter [Candidatus Omnitrophota bacterium]